MKRVFTQVILLVCITMITGSAYAQTKVVIPTKASEDKEAIMSAGYWAI